jgi:hypothetical protein
MEQSITDSGTNYDRPKKIEKNGFGEQESKLEKTLQVVEQHMRTSGTHIYRSKHKEINFSSQGTKIWLWRNKTLILE